MAQSADSMYGAQQDYSSYGPAGTYPGADPGAAPAADFGEWGTPGAFPGQPLPGEEGVQPLRPEDPILSLAPDGEVAGEGLEEQQVQDPEAQGEVPEQGIQAQEEDGQEQAQAAQVDATQQSGEATPGEDEKEAGSEVAAVQDRGEVNEEAKLTAEEQAEAGRRAKETKEDAGRLWDSTIGYHTNLWTHGTDEEAFKNILIDARKRYDSPVEGLMKLDAALGEELGKRKDPEGNVRVVLGGEGEDRGYQGKYPHLRYLIDRETSDFDPLYAASVFGSGLLSWNHRSELYGLLDGLEEKYKPGNS